MAELQDVRVTVLTDIRATDNSRFETADVLPVIRSWGVAGLFRIAQQVKRLRPDVVHIQSPTMGYPGIVPQLLPFLIRLLGIPIVQTWHEPVPGAGGLWLSMGLDVLITVREELLTTLSAITRKALQRTPFFWIPAGCMLSTITLQENERSAIRGRYVPDGNILLIYYGFVAPLKGIEIVLQVAAATNAQLLLACDLQSENSYHRSLFDKIESMELASSVSILGFLQEKQLAKHLAAADAVVLPFRDGARECNTSVAGAAAQGTFVLTTSQTDRGYHKSKNIYYAKPGDADEMIDAINRYSGCRNDSCVASDWDKVAEKHFEIYRTLC